MSFDIYSIKNETLRKVLVLFFISRPLFVFFSYLLFLIGFVYAQNSFSLSFFFMLILLFLFNHLAYGLNDLFDYETDKLNKRKGLLHGLVLRKKDYNLIKISTTISALTIFIGSFMFNWKTQLLLLVFIIMAYTYSCPPFVVKRRFLLDIMFNSSGYFLLILLGFSFSGSLNVPTVFYLGIIVIAGLAFHTQLVDYEADKKAEFKTTPVVIGKRASALFSFLCFLGIVLFYEFQTQMFNYFFYFLSFMMFILIFITKNEKLLRIHLYILYTFILLFLLYFFMVWVPKFLH